MSLRVRVTGAKRTVRNLGRAADLMPKELLNAADDVLDYLQDNMPDYPPPKIGSKYVRTMTLQSALESDMGEHPMSLSRVEKLGGDVQTILGVSGYGPFVVGLRRQQAWMHKSRWWTLWSHVQDSMRQIRRIYRDHVRRARRPL